MRRRLGPAAKPLSEEEQLLVTNRLHQVLCPFMLRRMKDSVLGNLPRKAWWVLHAGTVTSLH